MTEMAGHLAKCSRETGHAQNAVLPSRSFRLSPTQLALIACSAAIVIWQTVTQGVARVLAESAACSRATGHAVRVERVFPSFRLNLGKPATSCAETVSRKISL